MPQEFKSVRRDVRGMTYNPRKVLRSNNISGGEKGAYFIQTANQADLRVGSYDTLLRQVNLDESLRHQLKIFPYYLIVFWGAARTDGFVPTRLVGKVDQDIYKSIQDKGMSEAPDNAWFMDGEESIFVAAMLSQLYANLK